jgi:hypothetical protein
MLREQAEKFLNNKITEFFGVLIIGLLYLTISLIITFILVGVVGYASHIFFDELPGWLWNIGI